MLGCVIQSGKTCIFHIHLQKNLPWSGCNSVHANKTSRVRLRGRKRKRGRMIVRERDEMRCEGDTGAEVPHSDR